MNYEEEQMMILYLVGVLCKKAWGENDFNQASICFYYFS